LRSITTVVLIAAGVSLSLEFFQVFCHNRTPSMTDVICDTIGGCLGAYFSEQYRSTVSSEPVRYLVIEGDGSKLSYDSPDPDQGRALRSFCTSPRIMAGSL
jgi:hypothetical protein